MPPKNQIYHKYIRTAIPQELQAIQAWKVSLPEKNPCVQSKILQKIKKTTNVASESLNDLQRNNISLSYQVNLSNTLKN